MDGLIPRTLLADAIGPQNGRIDASAHIERSRFTLSHIPEDLWPSAGRLTGHFAGHRAVIVGGGPSLDWDKIKAEADARDAGEPVRIFAPNRSHDECVARGIIPDYGVLLDPSEHIADYITPRDDVVYLIATAVHWTVLKKFMLAEARCMLWAPIYDIECRDIPAIAEGFGSRPIMFVSGGSTVGQRIINIAIAWSMEPHLHGFDSCFLPGTKTLYAYDKPLTVNNLADAIIVSKKTGHQLRFRSNHHMAKQAQSFEMFLHRLPVTTIDGRHAPQPVTVHGDGVIPWIAWKDGGELLRHADPEAMEAKYGQAPYWDYAENRVSDAPFVRDEEMHQPFLAPLMIGPILDMSQCETIIIGGDQ